jgi:UDPglucose 6-dehydrogenase
MTLESRRAALQDGQDRLTHRCRKVGGDLLVITASMVELASAISTITICRDLLEEGAQLAIYDLKVDSAQVAQDLATPPSAIASPHAAATGADADAVHVLTEWAEFRALDRAEFIPVMRLPTWLFDARRIVNAQAARSAGFHDWQVGQG